MQHQYVCIFMNFILKIHTLVQLSFVAHVNQRKLPRGITDNGPSQCMRRENVDSEVNLSFWRDLVSGQRRFPPLNPLRVSSK